MYSDFVPANEAYKTDGIRKVRAITAGGMTNLVGGMVSACNHRNGQNSANMIILLSDGRPNVGGSNWVTIREQITAANQGYFEIYSIGIGSGAPHKDLKKLSLMNNGQAVIIEDPTDANRINVQEKLELFYKKVEYPILWNMNMYYENAKQVFISSSSLYKGQEVVVVGKLIDRCSNPVPVCNNDLNINDPSGDFCSSAQTVEFDCKVPKVRGLMESIEDRRYLANPKEPMDNNIDLKKYWAFAQMNHWFDIYRSSDSSTQIASMEEKITEQAVDKGFVTEFTSMVVVEDPETQARRLFEEAEDIPEPKEDAPEYKMPKQPKKIKIRQRRSTQFQKELQEKFADKVVEDLNNLERSRRGVQIEMPETHNSFAAQSLTFKFILPAICLLLVLSKSKIAKGLRRLYR